MPYKNIVFVKLEKRLFSDYRWYMMSETSQLNFIRFILFAAETYNKIPKNLSIIKKAFKTDQDLKIIEATIKEIKLNFIKFKENKHFYYFEDFDEKTNYITHREILRSSKGTPKEAVDIDIYKDIDIDIDKDKEEDIEQAQTPESSIEKKKPYIADTPLKKIIVVYKQVKGFKPDDCKWDKLNFARYIKSAKKLMDYLGDLQTAAECIVETGEMLDNKGLSWTLETIVKHVSDWKLKRERSDEHDKRG